MEYAWAAILVCGLAVWFIVLRKPSAKKECKVYSGSGIPEGREEEYRLALSPCDHDKPVMYTLHTCRHCVRLKQYLQKHGIAISEVYVDDFQDPARQQILKKLRSFNPRASFPTLVVKDGRCVVGFREEAVKDLFGFDR